MRWGRRGYAAFDWGNFVGHAGHDAGGLAEFDKSRVCLGFFLLSAAC